MLPNCRHSQNRDVCVVIDSLLDIKSLLRRVIRKGWHNRGARTEAYIRGEVKLKAYTQEQVENPAKQQQEMLELGCSSHLML